MNLLNKLRNKYFLAITTLALIVMASFGLFSFYKVDSVEAGMIKFDNETSISISNNSFTSHSDSSVYPRPLSNYTTDGTKTVSLKAGAINVTTSTYEKKYNEYGLGEDDNPYDNPYIYDNRSDDYVLMINSQDSCRYGYISNSFNFKANGHYYVTVSVYTIGDAGIASVYLLENGEIFEDCKLENIATSNSWINYTFYVSTNSYEDITLNFAMYLGGLDNRATGVVFFDDLHAGQIGERTLTEVTKNPSTAYKYVDVRHDFENVAIDTHFTKSEGGNGAEQPLYKNNIMQLSAADSYIFYKGEEITLEANTTHRFSMNVKVSEALTTGSAFVKLDEILNEEDVYDDFMGDSSDSITAKNSKLTVSSVTSSAMNDDWVEYVIYVRTGAMESSKVQFSFGLGDSSSNATGSASFKDFRIERVPYSAYNKASTGSTIAKMDISDRISLSSSQYSNHTFDKMTSDVYEGTPYPATATDWTLTSGEGYQVSGVVNLMKFNDVLAENTGMNNISAPNALNANSSNVLMMYNGSKSTQSYTSTSKSLEANKYYRIFTFVNVTSVDNGASVSAKLKNGENYSTILKIDEIVTNGEWQLVEFIIHTPGTNVDLYLELALGNGNKASSGYAFFDNIMIENAESVEDFGNTICGGVFYKNQYQLFESKTIDLNDSLQSLTSSKNYNNAVLYAGKVVSGTNANSGIVNLNNNLSGVIASSKEETLISGVDVDKILAISSTLNEDVYYTLTSLLQYKFESGKYYEFSIKVFTDGINQTEKENMYDNGILAQGVSIELTELENAKFSYITSEGKWTTYKLYIGLDTTCNSNLVLSLGSEFTGCYGAGFFGDIQLNEIEEVEFNQKSANGTTLVVNKVAKDEIEEETETKEKTPVNWANIITALVTSLTFIAVVLAVMAYVFKRNVKIKKRVKGGRAVYDRDITVMKSKYRRLATDQRDKEVRELAKECEELIGLRTEYENKYKEALNKVRSLKLSNRDGSKQHEISATEREVKHISKEVARYGMQINTYESEIEFMKTEGYLIDLERRMMREDTSSRNQLRKEALMSEEERKISIEKREQKLAKQKAKAERKAKKLADKEAVLQAEREEIEQQKQDAIEKDAEFVKAQELKRIKAEEEKLAKEKAKAEKELAKIKQNEEELKQDSEELEKELAEEKVEVETSEATNASETTEAIESAAVEPVEDVAISATEPDEMVEAKEAQHTETTEVEVAQDNAKEAVDNEQVASENATSEVQEANNQEAVESTSVESEEQQVISVNDNTIAETTSDEEQ